MGNAASRNVEWNITLDHEEGGNYGEFEAISNSLVLSRDGCVFGSSALSGTSAAAVLYLCAPVLSIIPVNSFAYS